MLSSIAGPLVRSSSRGGGLGTDFLSGLPPSAPGAAASPQEGVGGFGRDDRVLCSGQRSCEEAGVCGMSEQEGEERKRRGGQPPGVAHR